MTTFDSAWFTLAYPQFIVNRTWTLSSVSSLKKNDDGSNIELILTELILTGELKDEDNLLISIGVFPPMSLVQERQRDSEDSYAACQIYISYFIVKSI